MSNNKKMKVVTAIAKVEKVAAIAKVVKVVKTAKVANLQPRRARTATASGTTNIRNRARKVDTGQFVHRNRSVDRLGFQAFLRGLGIDPSARQEPGELAHLVETYLTRPIAGHRRSGTTSTHNPNPEHIQ